MPCKQLPQATLLVSIEATLTAVKKKKIIFNLGIYCLCSAAWNHAGAD
jgi:hypothetical protein